MNMMKNKESVIAILILLLASASPIADDQEHQHDEQEQTVTAQSHDDEEDHGEEDEAHGEDNESIELTKDQIALANISLEKLVPMIMNYQVYAPGEIKANGYTSYQVSPRVDSVVLRRHVALGDHVDAGQPLVTLFSESVADAQAEYRIANSEWRRVQQLGRKAVGEKRYISAQADYEADYGRLLAFGLSEDAIKDLSEQAQPLGEYTLVAATAGAVLSDDFHQGQRVESGQALMELADEGELWVEARLAPTSGMELPAGSKAEVVVGDERFLAVVTQEAHTIDPATRTRVIRMLVANKAHRLHPGQFADVYFSFATETPVLAVPESALMRSADGDWTIFVEEKAGEFKPHEVDLGRSLGKWREISGIPEGSTIVMEGAFFVASQLAKGGFDPHGH
jgi:membrane fusion protein, heavy metal efflux system